MNNPTNSHEDPFDSPEAQTQQLRDGLEDVYRLPVPSMHFDPLANPVPAQPSPIRRRWRPALLGAAVAAGLALFLVGPSLLGGSPQKVSAEQLLERTRTVATVNPLSMDFGSYHLLSSSQTPDGRSITTEVWFQDTDHQRSETRDAATGELITGFLKDGDDIWFYAESGGQMKATHTTLDGGIFSVGPGFGAQLGFGAGSLADLLSSFTSDCSDATDLGSDTVAGRPVYVIEVTPTPETCDMQVVQGPDGKTQGVMVSSMESSEDHGEGGAPETHAVFVGGPMTMWIDQETFMTLKTESSAGDGSFGYEVTSLDLDASFQAGCLPCPGGPSLSRLTLRKPATSACRPSRSAPAASPVPALSRASSVAVPEARAFRFSPRPRGAHSLPGPGPPSATPALLICKSTSRVPGTHKEPSDIRA